MVGRLARFVSFSAGVMIGERICPPQDTNRPPTARDLMRAEVDAIEAAVGQINDVRIAALIRGIVFR